MITNDGRYALISIMSNNGLLATTKLSSFSSTLLIATPTSCHLADEQHEPPEKESACFNIPEFYEGPGAVR
jgi:hypothetical protein